MSNKINLLLSSKSDICLLCHHLKANHFTDKDGDKYNNECDRRVLSGIKRFMLQLVN